MQEIKIFIISLKTSKDRQKKITATMKKLGLDFEFFTGLDGRSGLPEKYEKLVDRSLAHKRLGRSMSDSEIACALSHSLLYKKLIAEKIKQTIILEDDCIVGNDFAKMVKTNVFQTTSFDMILLYHHQARAIENDFVKFIGKYKIGNIINQATGAVGYYINYSQVKKLFEATKTISYVSDWTINTATKNIAVVVPRVIKHPKISNSIISEDRGEAEQTSGKKLFYKSKSLEYIRGFGWLSFLKYKLQQNKSVCVSRQIDGE